MAYYDPRRLTQQQRLEYAQQVEEDRIAQQNQQQLEQQHQEQKTQNPLINEPQPQSVDTGIPNTSRNDFLAKLEQAKAVSQAQGNKTQVEVFNNAITTVKNLPENSVITGLKGNTAEGIRIDYYLKNQQPDTPVTTPMMPHDPTSPLIADSTGVWLQKGYNLDKKETTPTGTTYFISKQEDTPVKGLAERMLDVQVTPLLPSIGIANPQNLINKMPLGNQPGLVRPLAPIAGLVASVESLVYFVPKITGVKGLPESPPTVIGGLIGKGIEGGASVFGINAPSNELETILLSERYGAGYGAFTIFGDVLTGFGVGKATSKAVQGYKVLAPKVNAVADKTLMQAYYKGGYKVTDPILQQTNKITSIIEKADAKASASLYESKFLLNAKVVTPVKETIVSPISSKLGAVKNTAIQESKLIKQDVHYMSEYLSPTKTTIYNKIDSAFYSPIKTNLQKTSSAIKTPIKTILTSESKPIIPKLKPDYEIASDVLRRLESNDRLNIIKGAIDTTKGYSSTVVNKLSKKVSETLPEIRNPIWFDTSKPESLKELSALTKVGAGKLRSTLNLKTPKDKLLKSEHTPFKFDKPEPVVAKEINIPQSQASVAIQRQISQPVKQSHGYTSAGVGIKGLIEPYPQTQRQREVDEITYLSIPKTSPLTSPKIAIAQISIPSVTQKISQTQFNTTIPKITQEQSFKQTLQFSQTQKQHYSQVQKIASTGSLLSGSGQSVRRKRGSRYYERFNPNATIKQNIRFALGSKSKTRVTKINRISKQLLGKKRR